MGATTRDVGSRRTRAPGAPPNDDTPDRGTLPIEVGWGASSPRTAVRARGRPNGVAVKVPAWLRIALAGALLVVLFGWALPRYVDYASVWQAVTALTGAQVVLLALIGASWTVVDSLVFTLAVPGLGLSAGYRAWLASNAVAGFAPSPADLAVRIGIYTAAGAELTAVASGVLLSSLVTTAVKLLAPTAAMMVLAVTGGVDVVTVPVAGAAAGVVVAAAGIVTAAVRSTSFAAACGRIAQRVYDGLARRLRLGQVVGLEDRAVSLRDRLLTTWRRRGWATVAAAVASQALLFAALVLSVRFIGVSSAELGGADLLVAYALGVAATLLPVLRSGVGASELIYLVVLGDQVSTGVADGIAAGAFTQRVFTWVLPVLVGSLVLVAWFRGGAR